MSSKDTLNTAIEMTGERLKVAPDFPMFDSILNQLRYLKAVIEGNEDRSKLNTIVVGHYAVHEFEETDPDYATELKRCQNMAYLMSQGKAPP